MLERSAMQRSTGSAEVASPAAILETLVGFDTSNPPGREGEAGDFLASHLQDLGFDVERQPVATGRSNVIAKLRNNGGPTLAFNTHMDVVPAAEGWTSEPFRLTRHGGRPARRARRLRREGIAGCHGQCGSAPRGEAP